MHGKINTSDLLHHQLMFGSTRTVMSEHPAALIIRARTMSRTLPRHQAKPLLVLADRLESIVGEIRQIRGALS